MRIFSTLASPIQSAMYKRLFSFRIIIVFLILSFLPKVSRECTNLIVTKGASATGSTMITYAADSHIRYGYLFFYPGGCHSDSAMLDIYHYENGKSLGRIKEAPLTYTVVGFMNDHQVAIGETTFGGLDSLASQPGSFLDYGSIMKIALQRGKTAREAIRVIAELVAEYGYGSGGESFSISDPNEAWIMEIIGKGKYEKGAVWVARRIPDGYVSGHANQARITYFPWYASNNWTDLKQDCYYSPDVISFAKKHKFYKGYDEDFSFSDVYNPLNFGGARFCDARVWSFFRKVNHEVKENAFFTEYAEGKIHRSKTMVDGCLNPNGFASNRLPLWVKADHKISRLELMQAMRDHYEGTPLDMRNDLGAGPFKNPYRWRPMEYKVDSVMYCQERAIATQQTGYCFVAESRSWLPDPIGGIFWFGVDDTDGAVYAPMYCGITSVPEAYAQGIGSMISWNDKSAFWTFNMVNNWAYSRYNVIHPEIEKYQDEYHNKLFKASKDADSIAMVALKQNAVEVTEAITDFSVKTANQLQQDWLSFFHYLFMKYMDGNIKQSKDRALLDNGNGKNIPPKPSQPGYGRDWERKMSENTGERFIVR